MLFLIPPSESKKPGGTGLSIAKAALTFGTLNSARDLVIAKLEKLCSNPKEAQRVLKLSERQKDLVLLNHDLRNSATMPALERYSGTLYEAINFESLGTAEKTRAKEMVLIQSALFGLIGSLDRIPEYRFSATTKLADLNLSSVWQEAHLSVFKRLKGPIIDLRSKQYVELAPIPDELESYWLEVVSEGADGISRALNHFNKKAKGELINAVLKSARAPQSIDDLVAIAESIGMNLRLESKKLILTV